MDTKEKNREAARQESRRRPDARVKNTEEPARRPVRQNPAPNASGQRTGERRTSSGQAKPRKPGAPSQTRTAPQGNVRRKSVPNPDRPEQVTRAVTAKPRTGKKKTGVLGLFSGSAGKKKPRKNLTPEERAEKRRLEEEAARERKERRQNSTA